MTRSSLHFDAIAADFEPLGNESRLLFVSPLVRGDSDRPVLPPWATGDTNGDERPVVSRFVDSNSVVLLSAAIAMPYGHGLLALGPAYLSSAANVQDPLFDTLIVLAESAPASANGFRFIPMHYERFLELAESLALRAVELFDDALCETRAMSVDERALAALQLFESEASIPYETRVMRRLFVLRINRQWERYLVALDVACERLGVTPDEIEARIVTSLAVLDEPLPYYAHIRARAAALFQERLHAGAFTDIAAEQKSESAYSALMSAGALETWQALFQIYAPEGIHASEGNES